MLTKYIPYGGETTKRFKYRNRYRRALLGRDGNFKGVVYFVSTEKDRKIYMIKTAKNIRDRNLMEKIEENFPDAALL